MTEFQAEWVLDGWYRVAHNEAAFSSLPNGAGRGTGDDNWQRDYDAWSYLLVQRLLDEIGTGVYYPRELVRLLEHRYKLGTLHGFELWGDKIALPPEIIGLGYRTDDLVQLAYRRLLRRIQKESVPKYFEAA